MNADFYKLVRTLESLTEETPESKKLENGKSVLKESTITEMDKSQPSSDRGGESSGDPYAKGGKAVPVTSRNMDKKALQTLNRSMNKAHKKDVKGQQQGVAEGSVKLKSTLPQRLNLSESTVTVDKFETDKLASEFFKQIQDIDEVANLSEYSKLHAQPIVDPKTGRQQQGGKLFFENPNGSITFRIPYTSDQVKEQLNQLFKQILWPNRQNGWYITQPAPSNRGTVRRTVKGQLVDIPVKSYDFSMYKPISATTQTEGVAAGSLEEVAPPGAKAERMVKHIKAGYAKDGDLTDKEKGIAYATAWKAHNKGKVEESQIDEGTDDSYYIVGIGRTAIKPVEVKTLSQAIADAKAMIARGQNVQVRQGSPIGAAMSLDMDTSTVPSREKDAERIAAYRNQRQEKIDDLMQARLNDMMRSAKTRDRLAKDAFARAEVDQLTMPLRANPTKDLAKKYDSGIKTQAPAKTWREVDKELMKGRTDRDYRRARAALRNPYGGLGVAEAKVKEAEVWRPGMPPPPNPDMGSSLTSKEQQRVVTPQGPGGVQQPNLPSEPKKPAQPKRSDIGTDTDVAETAKAKDKKSDRLPMYQESIRFKTINKLIREEFDLENDDISLEEKDIKSALGDDLFNELQAVKNGESEISEQLKDALFNYYKNTGELPPEVSRDEQDVTNYIKDRIMSMASEQPADRLAVSEDQKVKGTRYGGSAQVDDEETDDDTETKKSTTSEPKRGRGRPRKDSGDANTKAKYSGASDLQSMIVGNVPKKSKDLGKLPATKHKLKGE